MAKKRQSLKPFIFQLPYTSKSPITLQVFAVLICYRYLVAGKNLPSLFDGSENSLFGHSADAVFFCYFTALVGVTFFPYLWNNQLRLAYFNDGADG